MNLNMMNKTQTLLDSSAYSHGVSIQVIAKRLHILLTDNNVLLSGTHWEISKEHKCVGQSNKKLDQRKEQELVLLLCLPRKIAIY